MRRLEPWAGAPAVDPKLLVGLWVYATSEGEGSAREIWRLTQVHAAHRGRARAPRGLPRLQARHRALLRQSTDLGLVLRGTIGKRFMPCGKPAYRCKADPPLLHGPYYLWTRKVAGKTVTVRLTAEQVARCQP